MTDLVDKETRSRMMAGIKNKNTRPEKLLRSAFHKIGLRFRLHGDLPGKPDIVFGRYMAVVFVNGCFWHGHNCNLFKWPSTRPEFWLEKIKKNKKRDLRKQRQLKIMGWRFLTIWECAIKGKDKQTEAKITCKVNEWLKKRTGNLSIRGKTNVGRNINRLDK